MKKLGFIALAVLLISPVGAHATSVYGSGTCNPSDYAIISFFFPCGTGPGDLKEVMTVHSWGPISSPDYHGGSGSSYQMSYPQMPQLGTAYQYPQYSYPQTYQQYQPTYAQPQYSYPPYQNQQPTYYQPQYSYPQYSYAQPQYSQGWFGYPSPQGGFYQPAPSMPTPTQLSGITPRPVGGYDIWGDPLCDWGPGYYGHACTQDPHQWIIDTYTGQWY